MQSVGLALPELNQIRLDNVASPTQKTTKHWIVMIKNNHESKENVRITAVKGNIQCSSLIISRLITKLNSYLVKLLGSLTRTSNPVWGPPNPCISPPTLHSSLLGTE